MVELLLAELRRSWIQFIRYPLEALTGIFVIVVLFYGLVQAGSFAGEEGQLERIMVGYVLWTLVIFMVNDIALNLQVEAQTGTLEQIFLSPFGGVQIFLARALASLSLRLCLILAILIMILGLTGTRLHFTPPLIFPLVSVVLGAYGLALIMGSLALLFKRVQQGLVMLQFSLLFLLGAPTETWTGSGYVLGLVLPMTAGAGLLREGMTRSHPLDSLRLGIALLVGLAYFLLGLACFRWGIEDAKRRGILGTY
jgi:ABC-2 type transport system permease protein